ncbi:MAG TPA: DUF4097 family beta strand repeat-containing protein [Candidatus Thermoplasmatota archaeon]|nr:DUF4097 family beta strand repeat-containing protein [Candidatus Thermoplasmatota archaeon]
MSSVAIPSVPVIALVLALAGAGAGGAVLSGAVPLNAFSAPAAAPAPEGWEVLETYTGDVDLEAVTEGTLDLRTFEGAVSVIGWDEPSYEITVLVLPDQDKQRITDGAITSTFNEGSEGGLGLQLLVERAGNYDISTSGDGGPRVAVVANVPASISWTTAFVCSGATGGLGQDLAGPLEQLFGGQQGDQDQACTQGGAGIDMNIGLGRDEPQQAEEIPFVLEGLHGGELMAMAQYASLGVKDLSFEKLGLLTQYGEIRVDAVATDLAAMTQYGSVGLSATTDNLRVFTQYGDIRAHVVDGASGAIQLESQYGSVTLGVPAGNDRGYDAQASTQYGEIIIELTDAEGSGEDGNAALGERADLLGSLLVPPKRPSGYGDARTESAQTAGFDAKDVQVTIAAMTQYGDILITDGELPVPDDDQA